MRFTVREELDRSMSREQRIVEVLVEFADTLEADFDVLDVLHRVALRCIELLDCAEAGVLVTDAAGGLRAMASSSERADALELLQIQDDEGPCSECFRCGEAVCSADLTLDSTRWPRFAPAAVSAGFGSVHAVPMRARGRTIGGLNLFRSQPGHLAPCDVPVAQGLADIAAIGLLTERRSRAAHDTVSQLQGALQSRVVIEQAKGLLAERLGINMDDAFTLLRRYARQHRVRLSWVSEELIAGRLHDETLVRTANGGSSPGGSPHRI